LKLDVKNGTNIFNAHYSTTLDKETAQPRSYCVWTKGIESTLPKTDLIALNPDMVNFDFNRPDTMLLDWDRAKKEFGPLLEPLDIYSPRWRVREYPTDEQMALVKKYDCSSNFYGDTNSPRDQSEGRARNESHQE
jgi:hypothetical protein